MEPVAGSFAPIELVRRHADGPSVRCGFVASGLVTDGVAEDPSWEDDDMIGANAKVGVPALTLDQAIGQCGGEVVSDIIGALDVKQRPDVRLVRRRSPGDVLPINARYPQIADPQITSDAQALGQNPSVQHEGMIASRSDRSSQLVRQEVHHHKIKCADLTSRMDG